MTLEGGKWRSVFRPLFRILELFYPDEWHVREEMGRKDARKVSATEEAWLEGRDKDFLEFAERYLEALNTETLKAHDQTVQKALALAGWFGLLFAAFALPLGVMKDTLPAPREWPWSATLLISSAVVMLLVSLFGACRVLWRFKLIGDVTFWLLDPKFPTQLSLRRERIAELVERIPINKAHVAVKARLYQGAVWSFYLAVCLEIVGIATLFTAVRAAPPQSGDGAAAVTIASAASLTPTVSPTEVRAATATPAPTNTRRPTPRNPSPVAKRTARKTSRRLAQASTPIPGQTRRRFTASVKV